LRGFAFVQLHLRAADHELPHEKRITKAKDGTDIVVLGYAIQNECNWAARAGKESVTATFCAAQLWRCQRATHARAEGWQHAER
jgi:hypothetical protein